MSRDGLRPTLWAALGGIVAAGALLCGCGRDCYCDTPERVYVPITTIMPIGKVMVPMTQMIPVCPAGHEVCKEAPDAD